MLLFVEWLGVGFFSFLCVYIVTMQASGHTLPTETIQIDSSGFKKT